MNFSSQRTQPFSYLASNARSSHDFGRAAGHVDLHQHLATYNTANLSQRGGANSSDFKPHPVVASRKHQQTLSSQGFSTSNRATPTYSKKPSLQLESEEGEHKRRK